MEEKGRGPSLLCQARGTQRPAPQNISQKVREGYSQARVCDRIKVVTVCISLLFCSFKRWVARSWRCAGAQVATLLMWLHLCLRWFRGYFSFVGCCVLPLGTQRRSWGQSSPPARDGGQNGLPAWSPAGPRSVSIPHKPPSSPSENNCGFPACS